MLLGSEGSRCDRRCKAILIAGFLTLVERDLGICRRNLDVARSFKNSDWCEFPLA
jgi:hypothetical protein